MWISDTNVSSKFGKSCIQLFRFLFYPNLSMKAKTKFLTLIIILKGFIRFFIRGRDKRRGWSGTRCNGGAVPRRYNPLPPTPVTNNNYSDFLSLRNMYLSINHRIVYKKASNVREFSVFRDCGKRTLSPHFNT